MLRRTKYGTWTDSYNLDPNEEAVEYILDSAESVGIKVYRRGPSSKGTSMDMQFMAEVMRRLRGDAEHKFRISVYEPNVGWTEYDPDEEET